MQENIWNKNVLVSPNTRIRYPEHCDIKEYSIIDDFCYISTQLIIGKFFHIASNCVISGGKHSVFQAGNFGGIAAGTKCFCASDDFVNDIGNVLPKKCIGIKNHTLKGDIILQDFVTIGANSVILPNVVIPEGTCLGALSIVPYGFQFEPWSIYAMKNGKLTKIKDRNKDNVLRERDEILKRIKYE